MSRPCSVIGEKRERVLKRLRRHLVLRRELSANKLDVLAVEEGVSVDVLKRLLSKLKGTNE